MNEAADKERLLARWLYTREEWNTFRRWEKRRQGRLKYFLFTLFSFAGAAREIPEVIISDAKITCGQEEFFFVSIGPASKRVVIYDAGIINILSITGCMKTATGKEITEILVPVPRGRLREAIHIQDFLSAAE